MSLQKQTNRWHPEGWRWWFLYMHDVLLCFWSSQGGNVPLVRCLKCPGQILKNCGEVSLRIHCPPDHILFGGNFSNHSNPDSEWMHDIIRCLLASYSHVLHILRGPGWNMILIHSPFKFGYGECSRDFHGSSWQEGVASLIESACQFRIDFE